jgi:hypothetical protein
MNQQSKNEEPVINPDQLNITIRTSIPGYQRIQYKPSMTIKGNDEKGVKFNPLIKLEQYIIDKIPKQYKIPQFFNKGLFQSLINYTGAAPAKNLLQATRYGYVDNNIKVTLNTIFPPGSVIYIGNKPYAIGDFQWTTGEWSVEVKQKKEEIDPNKVTDPQLYTQLVGQEILTGEEQLKRLSQVSPTIVAGDNYTGPPPVAVPPAVALPVAEVDTEARAREEAKARQEARVREESRLREEAEARAKEAARLRQEAEARLREETRLRQEVEARTGEETRLRQEAIARQEAISRQEAIARQEARARDNQQLVVAKRQIQEQPVVPIVAPQIKVPQKALETAVKKNLLAISNSAEKDKSKLEQVTPEETMLYEGFKLPEISIQSTLDFSAYFLHDNYYNLVKSVFINFQVDYRLIVKQFYVLASNIITKANENLDTMPRNAYRELCNQTKIITSPRDGNCFFQAVADGINMYNYENQDKLQGEKIIHLKYGISLLFTPAVLRQIVLDYIQEFSKEVLQHILEISQVYATRLNDKFAEAIQGSQVLTEKQYLDIVNKIYFSLENFLVYKPTKILVDNYNSPFRVLEEREISGYIKSTNYWAEATAIEAICKKLRFCIIPIEKYMHKQNTYEEGKTIEEQSYQRLRCILVNNDLTRTNCSKKIMFLYHDNNHYELINFIYQTKEIQVKSKGGLNQKKETKYQDKNYTIFRENDLTPPMNILLLIYGSIYAKLDEDSKKNFSIYRPLMKAIDFSVRQILSKQNLENDSTTIANSKNFVKTFDSYFSYEGRSIRGLLKETQPKTQREDAEQTGGQYPLQNNYTPYQSNYRPYQNNYRPYQSNYTPYQNNYRLSSITKRPEDRDAAKIAYSITIDMELHPGTSLTPKQINESKCNSKYNAIRKAFAEFTGKPYVIPPVYPNANLKVNNTTRKIYGDKGIGNRKTRRI